MYHESFVNTNGFKPWDEQPLGYYMRKYAKYFMAGQNLGYLVYLQLGFSFGVSWVDSISHRIHVWYIFLHLAKLFMDVYGKCR